VFSISAGCRLRNAIGSRSQTEGSGLGLSTAKWIAEMHDADLSVTSKVHEGTVFQLIFPLIQTESRFLNPAA